MKILPVRISLAMMNLINENLSKVILATKGDNVNWKYLGRSL